MEFGFGFVVAAKDMGEGGVGEESVYCGDAGEQVEDEVGEDKCGVEEHEEGKEPGPESFGSRHRRGNFDQLSQYEFESRHGGEVVEDHGPGMSGFNGLFRAEVHTPHTALAIIAPIRPGLFLSPKLDRSQRAVLLADSAAGAVIVGEEEFGQEKSSDYEIKQRHGQKQEAQDGLINVVAGEPYFFTGENLVGEPFGFPYSPLFDSGNTFGTEAGMDGYPVGGHIQAHNSPDFIAFGRKDSRDDEIACAVDPGREHFSGS